MEKRVLKKFQILVPPIFNNKTRTKKSNYEGSLVGHYTTIGNKLTVARQIPQIWT